MSFSNALVTQVCTLGDILATLNALGNSLSCKVHEQCNEVPRIFNMLMSKDQMVIFIIASLIKMKIKSGLFPVTV